MHSWKCISHFSVFDTHTSVWTVIEWKLISLEKNATILLLTIKLSLWANRKTVITWPCYLLSTFTESHYSCHHAHPIQIMYEQITWDIMSVTYLYTVNVIIWIMATLLLHVKWVVIYIRTLYTKRKYFISCLIYVSLYISFGMWITLSV